MTDIQAIYTQLLKTPKPHPAPSQLTWASPNKKGNFPGAGRTHPATT
jgi:hypothetical protein